MWCSRSIIRYWLRLVWFGMDKILRIWFFNWTACHNEMKPEQSAKNIKIFNGCEVLIGNSVTRVTVRLHEACRVMPTNYPSDGIFNLHRRTIMDSFSCLLVLKNDMKRMSRRQNVTIIIMTSCTRVVLHPSCKTTFPSSGRVHRNLGRVCKKNAIVCIMLELSNLLLYLTQNDYSAFTCWFNNDSIIAYLSKWSTWFQILSIVSHNDKSLAIKKSVYRPNSNKFPYSIVGRISFLGNKKHTELENCKICLWVILENATSLKPSRPV